MLEYMKQESNMTFTENGAVTYESTGSECLDLFAAIGALRRENDEEIIEMLKDRKAIVLYNKTDLASAVSMEALKEKINHPLIPISAKEETGIAQLADTIKSMFFSGKISFNDEVYITNARHKEALEEAADSLAMVKQSIEDGMPEDFFSIDLMAAYGSLGKITGEEVGEDLVNEIFSKFCMGK